jgi:hypothetical protein
MIEGRVSILDSPSSPLAGWIRVGCPGDDGQPDLPSGGHGELPNGGQRDTWCDRAVPLGEART